MVVCALIEVGDNDNDTWLGKRTDNKIRVGNARGWGQRHGQWTMDNGVHMVVERDQ
jgi:hypothetical protein